MFALWIDVTFLRPCLRRVLEREVRDPRRRLLGDDLQALDHARHDLVLEPGVEILGVLADDHQVDALKARVDAGQVPHRPQVRVQVQRLAQADVDAGEPLPDRRRHRPFERHLVAADRIDQLHRQRLAGPLERDDAGDVRLPVDRDAGRFQDADDRFGDFGSDAVAGDQRDGVCHSRTYQIRRRKPRPMLTVISRLDGLARRDERRGDGDRQHQHGDAHARPRRPSAAGRGTSARTARPRVAAPQA